MHLLDRLKIVRVEQNDEDETLNATAAFIVDTALKMIIEKNGRSVAQAGYSLCWTDYGCRLSHLS
jgi:hypothetical protein